MDRRFAGALELHRGQRASTSIGGLFWAELSSICRGSCRQPCA
jgi:hypothetical protein